MKSTAHINGHPIHPMLVPYPFALLTSGTVFDVGAQLNQRSSWSRTGKHLTFAGLGAALVAAVPGLVDYFGSLPRQSRARRTAATHALVNLSALACFAAAASRRGYDAYLPLGGVLLSVAGTGLLSLGGWLGGELVYRQHVGVIPGEGPGPGEGLDAPGGDEGQMPASSRPAPRGEAW
jgi:uncharacterized membrane protein